jgi:hypothetical protein
MGVGRPILKHFSRRSQEIRERLARLGARSAHAAEVAALETRKAKDYNVPTDRLREEWRARAAELVAASTRRHPCNHVLADGGPSAGTTTLEVSQCRSTRENSSARRSCVEESMIGFRDAPTAVQGERPTESSPQCRRLHCLMPKS